MSGAPNWEVRLFAKAEGGQRVQSFRWDGPARDRPEAMALALEAAQTVWSVCATALGKSGAALRDGVLTAPKAKSSPRVGTIWAIGPALRAEILILGKPAPHGATPDWHTQVERDALIAGLDWADASQPRWEKVRVSMNDKRVKGHDVLWATRHCGQTWTDGALAPATADAALALAVTRWLTAIGGACYSFGTGQWQTSGSATVRAAEIAALRRELPGRIALASERLAAIGAPAVGRRLEALLDGTS